MEELSQLGVSSHRASSSAAVAAAAFSQTSASSPAASSLTSSANAAASVAGAAVAPPPLLGKGFFGWPIGPLPLISAHGQHHHPFPLHLDAAAPSSSCSPQRRSAAGDAATSSSDADNIKAKIIAHPRYSALLSAYINCQKVGAPPGVRERLSAAAPEYAVRQRAAYGCGDPPKMPTDPDLDRFMEAYCQMLVKHEEDLARPLKEAKEFLRNAEAELNSITHGSFHVPSSDENDTGACSSEDEQLEIENGTIRDAGGQLLPPAGAAAADQMKEPDVELKNYLLKRYSGHLTGLRQELCKKKKKKGKLPKEAIQKLLNWWEMHYKWPYPSETEKIALAESTGLDQKQINNWFINQRKRHWKPTEEKHFVLMDDAGGFNVAPSTHAAALYMADSLYHLNAP